MITVYNVPEITAAIGQYVTIVLKCKSDKLLSGKPLKFWYDIYNSKTTIDTTPDFQIKYGGTAGTTTMTRIKGKNHKAELKVINGKDFEIHYSFFALKDSYTNSTAFNSIGGSFNLRCVIDADNQVKEVFVPITISKRCDSVSFDQETFIPNSDLNVEVSIRGSVNNNAYIALINNDAVNDELPVVDGLFMSYAHLTSQVGPVQDLPFFTFLDGSGFVQSGTVSKARITIGGYSLKAGNSYQILIIYYQDGWKSCLSNRIEEGAAFKPIVPKFISSVYDDFGNEGKSCVFGLDPSIPISGTIQIDLVDYANQLQESGVSGSISDYLEAVKVFKSNIPSASSGTNIQFNNIGNGSVSFENQIHNKNGKIFFIGQYIFDYGSHRDIINVPIEVNYNAEVIQIENPVLANGVIVDELCIGEEYTFAIDFSGCEFYESINGASYQVSKITDGTNIFQEEIPIESNVCIKTVCGPSYNSECECSEICGTQMLIEQKNTESSGEQILTLSTDGSHDFIVEYLELLYGGSTSVKTIASVSGQLFLNTDAGTGINDIQEITILKITITKNGGCVYESESTNIRITTNYNPTGFEVQEGPFAYEIGAVNCQCPEGETTTNEIGQNFAHIDHTCDTENKEVTINIVEDFQSTVLISEKLMSINGGATFFPFTSPVSNQNNILVTCSYIFEDGSEPISVQELIICDGSDFDGNDREIELEIIGGVLEITITDDFNSPVLYDILAVSLDGGNTFERFEPASNYMPIQLNGNEEIVVVTEVVFEDGYPDIEITKTIVNEEIPSNNCIGYDDYSIGVTYDENTKEFAVTKNGDESQLTINQLLWTLGGSNPFDSNSSGIPYSSPVVGEGLFIARWKIKKDDCPEKILTAISWGKTCVEICDIPTVDVNFPSTPIEVCIIDCFPFDFYIDCNECELFYVAEGDLTGCDKEWTDPNGNVISTGETATPTIEGNYTLTITCDGKIKVKTFFYDKPEAGTPISNPIIV